MSVTLKNHDADEPHEIRDDKLFNAIVIQKQKRRLKADFFGVNDL